MIRNGAFMQAYNAQAAVSEDQIIVGHGVTNHGTDAEHLAPMMERVRANCGAMPKILSADTGYLSEANITSAAKSGIDAYIPARKSDAAKLATVPGTEKLIAHWAISLRGLQKAASEWAIVCACHNLLKLFRLERLAATPT